MKYDYYVIVRHNLNIEIIKEVSSIITLLESTFTQILLPFYPRDASAAPLEAAGD